MDQPTGAGVDYFRRLAATGQYGGPLLQEIERLADGTLSPSIHSEILKGEAVLRDPHFRAAELDLVLGYIQDRADRGPLSADDFESLRAIKTALEVREGELLKHRRIEIAYLLGDQLETILEDGVIDKPEELYQVELQDAFDLGYDQYLALIGPRVEQAVSRHQDDLRLATSSDEQKKLRKNLSALETLLELTRRQGKTLGHLF